MNASPNPRRAVLARPRPAEEAAKPVWLCSEPNTRVSSPPHAPRWQPLVPGWTSLWFSWTPVGPPRRPAVTRSAVLTVLADTRTAMALAGRFTQPHEPATTAA